MLEQETKDAENEDRDKDKAAEEEPSEPERDSVSQNQPHQPHLLENPTKTKTDVAPAVTSKADKNKSIVSIKTLSKAKNPSRLEILTKVSDIKPTNEVISSQITQPIPSHTTSKSHSAPSYEKEGTSSKGLDNIELDALEPSTKDEENHFTDEEETEAPMSLSRISRASNSSRLSYTVKRLFCCGVLYEAPSEDNISNLRNASGI